MTPQRRLKPGQLRPDTGPIRAGWVHNRGVFRKIGQRPADEPDPVESLLTPEGEAARARIAAELAEKRAEEPRLRPCGTDAAWYRHRAHGEDPCPDCVQAHNKAARDRKARRRAAAAGAAA